MARKFKDSRATRLLLNQHLNARYAASANIKKTLRECFEFNEGLLYILAKRNIDHWPKVRKRWVRWRNLPLHYFHPRQLDWLRAQVNNLKRVRYKNQQRRKRDQDDAL